MTIQRKPTCSAFEQIDNESTLGRLKRRALALNKLTAEMKSYLPRSTRNFTRVANYNGGNLVLETASNKAKLDISMHRDELLKKMKVSLPKVIKITVIVNPNLHKKNVQSVGKGLSSQTAEMLISISGIVKPELREALLKLANVSNK
ncbi:DciA family protein [Acerihabitans sp. TG2]|uniref:DciA family protein n=1 Tax=Acerihabitans sp. TG2 TaxID=3096008 RepID=UPI002B235D66|nr:DciA family protein [Acerihabitans sp. TG2]MEA9392155.1 DciA family protein [Acerihabitans sp. TG2]